MRLTLVQQDIYFEQLLFPNEPIYNIGAKIEIKGIINREFLSKAYHELINQHDAYRTTLAQNQEEASIIIIEEHNSTLGFIDFSSHNEPDVEANKYMREEFLSPFDLFNGKLLHKFTLVKISEDFHYLFSVYHHIITDGWGTSLMFQRFVQNYNEILNYGEVKTDYPYSYKDFVEDEDMYVNSESFEDDKYYWLDKFKFLPENIFDKLDDTVQINKSKRKELVIKREFYNQLNQQALSLKSSTFHLILGALYVYFGRINGNKDFAIGLPVLNRGKSSFKKTVGLFMGISPLRMKIDLDSSFSQFINDIKNQLRADYRHQRFPLGKLIHELKLYTENDKLFNITLSYEKQNYSTNFENTQTKVIPLTHESERVPLAIYIREFDDSEDVKIDFDYNVNFFDENKINQVVNHFETILKEVVKNPESALKSLNYLSSDERTQVVETFNNYKKEYPKEKTVVDLFKEEVAKTPNKIALKDDTRAYTYKELDAFSSQISNYLNQKYGANQKQSVAVLLDRSAVMVAVLLGILKSGKSYIPLDPAFPAERLSYIIENSQTEIIISEKDFAVDATTEASILKLEHLLEQINEYDTSCTTIVSPEDTAYIIYTSGSTGNPKGVEIGHRSLTNFLTSMKNQPGIDSSDTFFSVTTYSFDISILEFFTPLISGAELYVANKETLSNPELIIEKIEQITPTILQATPSFYQMLFNAGWNGNNKLKVLCGGDLLSESLAEKLIKNTLEVWNMYGPTETTIWSSIKKINQPKDASNIGKPINNTQIYLLDEFLNPLPIGSAGAIFIAGDGLAKGYYKNEFLTNERFIESPFEEQKLIYNTGDLGKWNANGEIEFLGRNDNQVKIRGYRIELNDIEAKLNDINGIKDSVVVAKKDDQNAFLVAFIIKSDNILSENDIINSLKLSLPNYMIPNVILELDSFPLTPNQKVDRKRLSQQDIHQSLNQDNFKVPTSSLEARLLKFWIEALNLNDSVSTDANFFALGGHSLNAVKIIGLIKNYLGYSISFKTFFEYPTVETLADYLKNQVKTQTEDVPFAEIKEFYEPTPSQKNIWLASQQKNMSKAYNMFAAFNLKGTINAAKIDYAINRIVQENEIIRTNFVEVNGRVFQRINAFKTVNFSLSIQNFDENDLEDEMDKMANQEFDLGNDLLLTAKLISIDDKNAILLFCTHHIIMDGISLELFIKKFVKYYNENDDSQNSQPDLFQFKDYSEWFIDQKRQTVLKNGIFWKNYLESYVYKHSIERDFNEKGTHNLGSEFSFQISEETTLRLKELALANKTTLYTLLLSGLAVLINKLSKHTDICIGTVDSGRNLVQSYNQIGMFVKTVVLRAKINPKQSFTDILNSIQSDLFELKQYPDIPFEDFTKSFFDIMLIYQNPDFSDENISNVNGFNMVKLPREVSYTKMPLLFNLNESENRIKGSVDFNSNMFEEETISYIVSAYVNLLNEISRDPQKDVQLLSAYLILENENSNLNFDFNF